jgi:drug/metabolite transporter (DMT)-like permease
LAGYLGELAALVTALCWSFSSIFYTLAGRRLGSVIINRLRLLLSLLFLGATHWLLLAAPLPLAAEPERWFWLGLSGIIGLTVGDTCLFQAYIWIGPRLAMLLKSLAPVFSALLAWLFLAELLNVGQIGGMVLTIGGVSWVVMERDRSAKGSPDDRRRYLWGILFGLGAALSQAAGLVAAKKGLGGHFPALSGHVIRMLVAATSIWAFTLLQGQAQITVKQFTTHRRPALNLTIGTVLGPFVGVWFSLIAVQWAQVGIASTLMALVPIFMLPIGRFVFKEQISNRAIIGTVVAVIGVALLFLR